jgi:chromosomal replication initiation ATPase DnaA
VPSQLTLPLGHQPHYGRDDFIAGPSNKAALRLVEIWPDWPSPVVVLTGPPGSGKTHLTHVWAERAGADILQASRLETGALVRPAGPLAVEDVAMDAVREQPLFHLINSVSEAGTHLLITSRAPAAEWRVGLADLRSRLRLATPVAVDRPDEDLLRKVLVKLFADRQLLVDKAVVDYLLLRMERSLGAALVLVEALDRQALATGSRITRAMAANILAEAAVTQEFSGSD